VDLPRHATDARYRTPCDSGPQGSPDTPRSAPPFAPIQSSPIRRFRRSHGTTCERVVRPGADDCNHWTKRARVSRRLGLLLVVRAARARRQRRRPLVNGAAWLRPRRVAAVACVFGRCEGDGRACAVPCLGAGFRLRETIRRRGAGRSGGRRSCPAARALRTAVVARVSKDRANQALGSAVLTPPAGCLVVAVRRVQVRPRAGEPATRRGVARCPGAGGAES
jgi:hypothetical protein